MLLQSAFAFEYKRFLLMIWQNYLLRAEVKKCVFSFGPKELENGLLQMLILEVDLGTEYGNWNWFYSWWITLRGTTRRQSTSASDHPIPNVTNTFSTFLIKNTSCNVSMQFFIMKLSSTVFCFSKKELFCQECFFCCKSCLYWIFENFYVMVSKKMINEHFL